MLPPTRTRCVGYECNASDWQAATCFFWSLKQPLSESKRKRATNRFIFSHREVNKSLPFKIRSWTYYVRYHVGWGEFCFLLSAYSKLCTWVDSESPLWGWAQIICLIDMEAWWETVMEDPKIIQQNIQYFQYMLTLYSTEYTRNQVRKLLGLAQEQLSIAENNALNRKL